MNEQIKQWLERVHGQTEGKIDIRAIGSDPAAPMICHPASSIDEAAGIIEELAPDHNVFTGVARRRRINGASGAGGKDDLSESAVVWVDVDLDHNDKPAELSRLRSRLEEFPIPPSMRVDSGGGVHLYWDLDEPVELIDPDDIREFEAVLKGLAEFFNGDRAATDASRILRVPGTTNYPDEHKVKKGRVPAPCRLREAHDRSYSFGDFDDFALEPGLFGVAPAEYERKDWTGEVPDTVARLLGERRPDGSPKWGHLHKHWDVKVTSDASSDDMIVAIQLALRGVEPADIENALRYRRDMIGAKGKRDGYYALTIAKAMARASGMKDGTEEVSVPAPHHESKRFRLLRPNEIVVSTTRNDLIRDVIECGTLSMIYGHPGSSKSLCALEMGLRVASGTPWRGHPVRRGTVLYIAAEGGRGVNRRFEAALRAYGLEREHMDFILLPGVVHLTDGGVDTMALMEQIRSEGIDDLTLVIFDTLAQSMPGANENSPEAMGEAVGHAQDIMFNFDAAVLLVHHSGKDIERGARGHSSLNAAIATELQMVMRDDGLCVLKATKQRDAEVNKSWSHRIETVEVAKDSEGEPITSAVVHPLDTPPPIARHDGVRASSSAARAVRAVEALAYRPGAMREVPPATLASSGYTAWVAENGRDVVKVRGTDKEGLRLEIVDNLPADRPRESRVQQANKDIRAAVDEGLLWTHGGMYWLRERFDGENGERNG